jgi:hypothetical protein
MCRKRQCPSVNLDSIFDHFDLNCTKAGINLATHELVLHPHFLEFIQSEQLRITNLSTPVATCIRILEKQRQLGAKLPPHLYSLISVPIDYNGVEIYFQRT